MVTIDQTRRKYRGRKAETYDEVRVRQTRWVFENREVERMLRELAPVSVLDCPVGTGRFLDLYHSIGATVVGIDVSDEMLSLARKKMGKRISKNALLTGDAANIDASDRLFDAAVCVRFLDLIDQDAMRAVMRELTRVARRAIILTIRLGEAYHNKSNTATHDRRRWFALVNRLGWSVVETVQFRDAGWTIARLQRD